MLIRQGNSVLKRTNISVMFGNNQIQLMTDYHLLTSLQQGLGRDPDGGEDIREAKRLLLILLKDETFRVNTWLNPLSNEQSVGPVAIDDAGWPAVVRQAWKVDPEIAVHLRERFNSAVMMRELRRLILTNPEDVIQCSEAAEILLGDSLSSDLRFQLKVSIFSLIPFNRSISCIGSLLYRRLQ
jgi:phosphatidylinositol 4-kinase A